MTTELWILLSAALLQWLLIMIRPNVRIAKHGLGPAFGNREQPSAPIPEWAERAQRASDNMHENLILFAIVVLVVHVAGKSSDISVLGAQLFLGARVLHALLYIGGVKVVRTVAWFAGVIGTFMVASAVF